MGFENQASILQLFNPNDYAVYLSDYKYLGQVKPLPTYEEHKGQLRDIYIPDKHLCEEGKPCEATNEIKQPKELIQKDDKFELKLEYTDMNRE